MRIAYSVALIFLIIIILVFCFKPLSKKNRNRRDNAVLMLLVHTIPVMNSNVLTSLSTNLLLSRIGFAWYFLSLDVLIFSFMELSFTTMKKRRLTHTISIICITYFVIDFLLIGASVFFPTLVFDVIEKTSIDKLTYLIAGNFSWGYYMHLVFCYGMLLVATVYLIIATIRAPRIYLPKYSIYFLMIAIVVIVNALYMIFDYAVDWSVLFYPLFAFVIYFVSIGPVNDGLLRSSMTGSWLNGVVLFNEDDECNYVNEFTEKRFTKDLSAFSYDKGIIREWCGGVPLKECQDFDTNWKRTEDGKDCYYYIRFKKIFDGKKYVGSFFCIQDITENHNRVEVFHHKATHDGLTDLFNKEEFLLRGELLLRDHPDETFVAAVTDIHNFKLFNDMYGVRAGDNLLRDLAQNFHKNRVDHMVYGRLENDHIGVVLPKKDFHEDLVVKSLDEIFRKHIPVNSIEFSCFMGVFEIPAGPARSERSLSVLMNRALSAVENVHDDDLRTVIWYNDEMKEKIHFEQSMNNDLTKAIENREITMYLQPQMDASGKLAGAEALVRWIHPVKGIIPPGQFIPYFEKNGRISEIDLFIWEEAAKKLSEWKKLGYPYTISVNISRYDLYFIDVAKELNALVRKYDIANSSLHLEITETVMMNDVERMSSTVRELQEDGFLVEMDDFGSAYSSLNALKDIYIDTIKMDLGFLKKSRNQKRAKLIIESAVTLAKKLDLGVVFEGVETKSQLDYVTGIGCDIVQGFYYDRPIPVSDFEAKYLK